MNIARRANSAAILTLAMLACSAALAAPAKDEYVETIDQTLPLSAGGRFTLDNRNGGITIETWDREEIHIDAVKRMRPNNGGASWLLRLVGLKADETATDEQASKLFSELEVEIGGDAASRSIATHYPTAQGVEFDVTYRITAPRRVVPTINAVNSTVHITGVEGDTSVETTNGKVSLSDITGAIRVASTNGRLDLDNISGAVEAETTNGSVTTKTRPDAPIGGPISLRSTNGSVEVVVPSTAAFGVDARTVNGSVSCDLPLASTQTQSRKRLQGTVGAGGPLITLRTTNGSVRVESAN